LVEVGEIRKIYEKNRIWDKRNVKRLCFCFCHKTLKSHIFISCVS